VSLYYPHVRSINFWLESERKSLIPHSKKRNRAERNQKVTQQKRAQKKKKKKQKKINRTQANVSPDNTNRSSEINDRD